MKKISATIVAHRPPSEQSPASLHKSQQQLSLWESPPSSSEYPLVIEPLPPALQWWNERRYWLIHQESGLRVPGSFSLQECQHIQQISQGWDWTVNTRDRKVACGVYLLAALEAVCKGGES